jgi:hypothetical protein
MVTRGLKRLLDDEDNHFISPSTEGESVQSCICIHACVIMEWWLNGGDLCQLPSQLSLVFSVTLQLHCVSKVVSPSVHVNVAVLMTALSYYSYHKI